MRTKQYVKEYTNGERICFKHILLEVEEFLVELIRLNLKGMSEEFQDVLHFLQLWLYWRFGLNGEIWPVTKTSVSKFMSRKKTWQKIYLAAGLDKNISNFCGNYKRKEKVMAHLARFRIGRQKAEKAYQRVVLNQSDNNHESC